MSRSWRSSSKPHPFTRSLQSINRIAVRSKGFHSRLVAILVGSLPTKFPDLCLLSFYRALTSILLLVYWQVKLCCWWIHSTYALRDFTLRTAQLGPINFYGLIYIASSRLNRLLYPTQHISVLVFSEYRPPLLRKVPAVIHASHLVIFTLQTRLLGQVLVCSLKNRLDGVIRLDGGPAIKSIPIEVHWRPNRSWIVAKSRKSSHSGVESFVDWNIWRAQPSISHRVRVLKHVFQVAS